MFPGYATLHSGYVLKVNKPERASRVITPGTQDKYAPATMTSGNQMRMEFYKGNGYLSQSSGSILLPARVREVKIFQSDGAERLVIPEPM